MPLISSEKKKKISEQVLELLYSQYPHALFTAQIAREIARDEEFTKKLLEDLEKKSLLKHAKTNPEKAEYSKRMQWTLSPAAKQKYDELVKQTP